MRKQLFRQEVADEQNNRTFGQVLIQPTWTARAISYLLMSLFACALLFLFLGTYHRKESARGILIPSHGVIKVFPPRSGIVARVHVHEGSQVEGGTELFELAQVHVGATGENISVLKRQEMEVLREKLQMLLNQLPQLQKAEAQNLQLEIELVQKNRKRLEAQIRTTQRRLDLKTSRLDRLELLHKDKAISQDEVDREKDSILQLQSQVRMDQRDLDQQIQQGHGLEARVKNLAAEFAAKESQILQELNQVKQQIMDLDIYTSQSIQAPIAGKVTALQVHEGSNVDSAKPALTILPRGGRLEAHLFVPTRARAFLEPGQRVLLQYDAFPFQKYGVFAGSIKEISQSVLNPGEVQNLDLAQLQEPIYRVVVTVDLQSIKAIGRDIPLQSGMLLRADIVLEDRSLIEWLLEPLYRAD